MENLLYPDQPVRCIITGPSEKGKTTLLIHLILNIVNDYDKIYIYSPSIHQESYRKLIRCFECTIPVTDIVKLQRLKYDELADAIKELVEDENFEPSPVVMESYPSIDELMMPEDYDETLKSVIILDDLTEKELQDKRVQSLLKRARHNGINVFVISQDYYELPKKTVRANGKIFHLFKSDNFRDVQSIYQDKASMDMTLKEFKDLCNYTWSEDFRPLTIDTTKKKWNGRYRVGLTKVFVPRTDPFT